MAESPKRGKMEWMYSVSTEGVIDRSRLSEVDEIRKREDVKEFQEHLNVIKNDLHRESMQELLKRDHTKALTTDELLRILGTTREAFFRKDVDYDTKFIFTNPRFIEEQLDEIMKKFFGEASTNVSNNVLLSQLLHIELEKLHMCSSRLYDVEALLVGYYLYKWGSVFFFIPDFPQFTGRSTYDKLGMYYISNQCRDVWWNFTECYLNEKL